MSATARHSDETQGPYPWAMPFPGAEQAQAIFERVAAMPKVMKAATSVRKGVTPHDVVYRENKLRVLRYHGEAPPKYSPPLLLVFALVNRPYIFDILPNKSVVRQFVDAGFDVHLVDWGCPGEEDCHLRGEDYIDGYLHNVVRHVCESTGQKQLSLMGYCMGGTVSAMYTALHQEWIRNLILLTAPIDFTSQGNLLSAWADPKYFDVDSIVDTFGNPPPWLLQTSFLMLKPVQNLIEKYLGFYERMTDEKFLEEFFAMETWINDNIPLAGETYREWVKNGYHRNLLVKGQWPIGKRKVDLRDITCPVLNLMASEDHLVPCGQSAGFNALTNSQDAESITLQSGHIGLAVGGRAHRELWPKVCQWLAKRSEPAGVVASKRDASRAKRNGRKVTREAAHAAAER
ncbi:MAG: class III poly(R)-hydroxyalkanoic acid synthase subunit PhaC [Phycisphaerae bacterium]